MERAEDGKGHTTKAPHRFRGEAIRAGYPVFWLGRIDEAVIFNADEPALFHVLEESLEV